MRYPYVCIATGDGFEIAAPMSEGPPDKVVCPYCGSDAKRVYSLQKEIWNTDGSSKDYFKVPVGRGQPMDKKEWLNKNWSEYSGQEPPPPDSKGTYDGT